MKFWVRLILVASGLAILAISGGYFLGQSVPGLSSSLAQSLSIAILSLGIASSTIAVLSGRGIEEYFKRHNEERRIKSALVSYLAGLPFQIVPITSMFYGLSQMKPPVMPRKYPEGVPPEYDRFIMSQLETHIQAQPIDTSYYEKNIKDHLLYLPEPLARQSLFVTSFVSVLNYHLRTLEDNLSSKTLVAKEAFPAGYIVSIYLATYNKTHQLISEQGRDLRDYIQQLTSAILEGKERLPNFEPLVEKAQKLNDVSDSADKEFMGILFPSASLQT
jgi:hypothetical protein